MRRRPYTVVLLDEVEKAHPEVFDVLLQVLDDGRLTDGQGRTVDFRNAILVLTSNLGSAYLVDPTARRRTQRREAVLAAGAGDVQAGVPQPARRHRRLRPARRTDELARIVDLQVARLGARLGERRLDLEVTPAAREWLALAGFDPVYGARPLRRLVQSAIGDRLAKALLAGDVRDGSTVTVDVAPDGSGLTLT